MRRKKKTMKGTAVIDSFKKLKRLTMMKTIIFFFGIFEIINKK